MARTLGRTAMINAGFVDFAFAGVAVVPEVLLLAGYAAEALLLMVPMLIGACLISLYFQQAQGDESAEDPGASAPDATAPVARGSVHRV